MREEQLCDEIHKRVDERLTSNDVRLNGHSIRLDKLEQRGASVDTKIENLCEQIRSLVSTIKWAAMLMISTLLAFFIWYIQHQ